MFSSEITLSPMPEDWTHCYEVLGEMVTTYTASQGGGGGGGGNKKKTKKPSGIQNVEEMLEEPVDKPEWPMFTVVDSRRR